MRKVLLGSTALVAAGMLAGATGSPAQAAEPITLSLGGYYQVFLTGRVQSDVDNEGVGAFQSTIGNDESIHPIDVQQEGEVFFVGSTTLDNGIKVGVNIQLEAYQKNDQIDEHYVFFSGNFGRLVIGAENSAPYIMHYSAPGAAVGHGLDSPNMFTMIGTVGNDAGGFGVAGGSAPLATPANLASDANKITYFTPRFSPGFQFGFSYTPDTTDNGGRTGGSTGVTDSEDVGQEHVIGLGMNIVRTIGSVDFAWSFGFEHGFVEGNGTATGVSCGTENGVNTSLVCIIDPDNQQGRDILTTGFNLGIGGWTVGGAFQYDDEGQERNNEQYSAVLGFTYGAGPWLVGAMGSYALDGDGEVSIGGINGRASGCSSAQDTSLLVVGGNAPTDGRGTGCSNDSDTIVAGEVSGSYTLGPGVKVSAAVQAWSGSGDDGNENFDGVGFTMGTGLSF